MPKVGNAGENKIRDRVKACDDGRKSKRENVQHVKKRVEKKAREKVNIIIYSICLRSVEFDSF